MPSKLADVLTALRGRLETVTEGTVYEPDRVQPVLFWPSPDDVPEGTRTFYCLALGQRVGLNLESCHVTDRVEVAVLACTRYVAASSNVFREKPSRLEVAMDLEADVLLKLRGDEKLANGGDAEVLDVFAAPPVTDFERYDPAWVIVEITLQIRYRFNRADR